MYRLTVLFLFITLWSCQPEEDPEYYASDKPTYSITKAPYSETVATMEQLQEMRVPSREKNYTVEVLGYHRLGDGGGGSFLWTPSSVEEPNAGTVVASHGRETGRWKRQFNGDINVVWFGATGDGETNDFDALNNAFQYGNRKDVNVFIPSGNYMILSGKNSNTGFELVEPSNFSIYGEEGTTLSTSLGEQEGFRMFYLLYGGENLEIKNIFFENTHGLTQHRTTAIQTIQGGGTPLKNLSIKNCSFAGFSTSILPNGTENLNITNCQFYAPIGRDSALNNRAPAVYIWLHSNENGNTVNTTIKDCYAEGYSGTDISSTATKEPFDGFLYGMGDGIVVENNTIRKMGYEAIFLQPNNNFVSSAGKKPVVIRNNDISFEWMGKMKNHRTYGIRVDDSAVQISENKIQNATFGVLVYGYDYSYDFSDLEVSNNIIRTTAEHGNIPRAVFIQGNKSSPVKNIKIMNNSVLLKGAALSNHSELFFFADVNSAVISENTFEVMVNKNGKNLDLIGFDRKNENFCLYANRGKGNFDKIYSNIASPGNRNFRIDEQSCTLKDSKNGIFGILFLVSFFLSYHRICNSGIYDLKIEEW